MVAIMLMDIAARAGDYVQAKDVIGPLVGGLLGWLGARHSARASTRVEEEKMLETRRVSSAEDLSHRFKVLMDGYEGRIKDLTEEVSALREKVEKLSRELTDRTVSCASCPFSPDRELLNGTN